MYYTNKLYVQNDDICYSCKHSVGEVTCPLIGALSSEITYLVEDITVHTCGMFEEKSKHLKIIK